MRRTLSWAVNVLSLGTVPLVRYVNSKLAGTKTGNAFWWTAAVASLGTFSLAYYSAVGIASLFAMADEDELDDEFEDDDELVNEFDDEDDDDELDNEFDDEDDDDELDNEFDDEDDDDELDNEFDDEDDEDDEDDDEEEEEDDDDDPRTWTQVAEALEAEEAAQKSSSEKPQSYSDCGPLDEGPDARRLEEHLGRELDNGCDTDDEPEEIDDGNRHAGGLPSSTAEASDDSDEPERLYVLFVEARRGSRIWETMPCGATYRQIARCAHSLIATLERVATCEKHPAQRWISDISRLLETFRGGVENTRAMRSLLENSVIPGLVQGGTGETENRAIIFAEHLLATVTDAEQMDWDRDAKVMLIGDIEVRPLPDENDVIERLAVAYTEFHRECATDPQVLADEYADFILKWQMEVCRTRGFTLDTTDYGTPVARDDSGDVVFVFELARQGHLATVFLSEAGLY